MKKKSTNEIFIHSYPHTRRRGGGRGREGGKRPCPEGLRSGSADGVSMRSRLFSFLLVLSNLIDYLWPNFINVNSSPPKGFRTPLPMQRGLFSMEIDLKSHIPGPGEQKEITAQTLISMFKLKEKSTLFCCCFLVDFRESISPNSTFFSNKICN